MKPYFAPDRIPFLGVALLISGSTIAGLVIGALAYLLSGVIYYLVIFSIAIGVVTMLAYYRLLQLAKVRHSIIGISIGLLTGFFVALGYYGSPYLVLRNEFIIDAQKNHNATIQEAAKTFDRILGEETGSSGFLGYMELRAKEGDQYTNYLIENGMPIHEFNFTLKSTWAWLYWFLEIVFFSLPAAYIGYEVSQRAFSESANDWYDPLPKQIGAVPIESKERLLVLLGKSNLSEINKLVVEEERLEHPMLEIYEQHSNNKKGDILLSVKQTFYDKNEKVKRNNIGQWEISEQKYVLYISHQLAARKLQAG